MRRNEAEAMRKNSGPIKHNGAYTSPGSPIYNSDPKSWTLEQSPTSRTITRNVSATALIPLSNGKTPPSKWDDAERWITSPVSGQGFSRSPVMQLQRQVKSKSGPLRGPGVVFSSNCSPSTPKIGRGNVRSSAEEEESCASTAMIPGSALFGGYDDGGRMKLDKLDVGNSGSVLGMTEENLVPNSQDEKVNDRCWEKEPPISTAINGKDMATQTSHGKGKHPSRKESLSFSVLTSLIQSHNNDIFKDEIRDVQVDKGAIATATARQFVEQERNQTLEKNLNEADEGCSPQKANFKASRNPSKLQREEAKITSWENLQRAKAEEAIQKLEMKLEKRRLASTVKIMNKLRAAQMRAEVMRNSLSENQCACEAHAMRRRGVSSCLDVKGYSICDCFVHRNKN